MSYLTKKHISKASPMILKFNMSSCKFSLVSHGYLMRLMTCLIDDTGWSLWAEIFMLLAEQQLLSSCPLEGKNSIKRHSRVSGSRSFLSKAEALLRKESRLSGEHKQPHSEGAVRFLGWRKLLLCVLCPLTDKVIDGLRLYTFSPCAKHLPLTLKQDPGGKRWGWGWG